LGFLASGFLVSVFFFVISAIKATDVS
jgi:hypothetical protein